MGSFRGSRLGLAIMVIGRYLVSGYFDPQGVVPCDKTPNLWPWREMVTC